MIHESQTVLRAARELVALAPLYGASVRRVLPAGGRLSRRRLFAEEDRLVFVAGCPRSGTTFLAGVIAEAPGFVDLGEVTPLKAAIPQLVRLSGDSAAERIRSVLERVRWLSLVRGFRGVEQTPEMAYLLPAAARAYPHARAVHLVRDGRDVVASLLERGWLSAGREGRDDAHTAYGPHARFWVDPDRVDDFERGSDATRAALAWRSYVSAARSAKPAALEIRYEDLVRDPRSVAAALAEHLDAPADAFERSLRRADGGSIGRHRRDLTAEQLRDVEREAGPLLEELGYA